MSPFPFPERARHPGAPPRARLRPAFPTLPQPIRFFLLHAATGMAIGSASGLAMILADAGGLGRLLAGSPHGLLAGAALIVLLAGTGGGIQFAMAIGLTERDGTPAPRPPGRRQPALPVPVLAARDARAPQGRIARGGGR